MKSFTEKRWIKKLLEQFEIADSSDPSHSKVSSFEISDERATLLHCIDVLSKHLIETENHSLRKTREALDELAKSLAIPHDDTAEKSLFRFRQFFTTYRIDEYTYIQKTFNDFKNIIWDFADQLGDDLKFEKKYDLAVKHHLDHLREAVESNSIEELRTTSREFIDSYTELQNVKDRHRAERFETFQSNYTQLKKQLNDAKKSLQEDHLTGAFNRRSFDEQMKNLLRLRSIHPMNVTMIALDIDFFKKINDNYGHDVGDFILKECVKTLKSIFHREQDFVARIGGEEFVVILPDYKTEHAIIKAEELKSRVNKDIIIHGENKIQFTISMGIAQLTETESAEQWLKRADQALYQSKQTGRNKYTVSENHGLKAVS